MKKIVAAALLFAGIAGPASAQAPLVEIDDAVMVEPFAANADTVDDWDVYDAAGTKVGDVEEVLGTDANTPTALAVDFEGTGGYADRDVVIPLDQFTLTEGRLVLGSTPDAVGALPTWDD